MRRLPKASLAALAALSLALAACGDDDDTPSDDTSGEDTDDTSDEGTDDTSDDDGTDDTSDEGTDDTSDDGTDDTDPPDDTDDEEGTDDSLELPDSPEEAEEQAREILGQLGMSDEQIDCLVDNIDTESVAGGDFDPTQFMDLFQECGIELSDLQPGG